MKITFRPNSPAIRSLLLVLHCFIALLVVLSPAAKGSPLQDSSAQPRRFKLPKRIVNPRSQPPSDPPQVALGERLFLEHRFSQFFHANSGSNANATLRAGDPVVAVTLTPRGTVAGPFAGLAMNCRACHLVSEQARAGLGNRAYADYAARSPIPKRGDGRNVAVRNTPAMVNASIPREAEMFLHADGEFPTGADLVKGTFTGRNFGWLPEEQLTAVTHIAHIIRNDDGGGELAREFGGAYRQILPGTDPGIPEQLRLPAEYRLDVAAADDAQILAGIARLVEAYMDSLSFSRDEVGEYDASPYDVFLETNRFERMPADGQIDLYYSRHLLSTINAEPSPRFIRPGSGRFQLLDQEYRFGADELAGLKIFFALAGPDGRSSQTATRGVGNCIACHAAPHFTDFRFHNTGAAQEEYDALHGPGSFGRLEIPSLAARNNEPDKWLPPGTRRPKGRGPFMDLPGLDRPGRTDLGLWNILANPDCPLPQTTLHRVFAEPRRSLSDDVLLPRTIALFKTPGLRGLALSGPFLHTGRMERLEDVIGFYREFSELARVGKLRNAAPELLNIRLGPEDIKPLAAFLRALNEDYE